LCKTPLIECPIFEKNVYTTDAELFIPKEDTIKEYQIFP
jgi:hypothetical protein